MKAAFVLTIAALAVTGFIGWVMNIVALCHMLAANNITAMFFGRIVGVFVAPIGAILGLFF